GRDPKDEVSPAATRGELGDDPCGSDPSDPIGATLSEPEITIRPGRDLGRFAGGRDARSKFSDNARGGNPADGMNFGEPEVTVRPRGDPEGLDVGRRDRELRNRW